MTAPPIPCVWTGQAFAPLPRFHNVAAGHYGEGEIVNVVAHEERSLRSHGHYFAALHDLWLSLPESMGDRWVSEEQFRKHGLIATGWRDERTIVCSSKAEALRLAAFVRPIDEYAIVTVREAVVTVYTAKSQSQKAMGKEAFQKSKDDVLGWASDQVGVHVSGQGAGGVRSPARAA